MGDVEQIYSNETETEVCAFEVVEGSKDTCGSAKHPLEETIMKTRIKASKEEETPQGDHFAWLHSAESYTLNIGVPGASDNDESKSHNFTNMSTEDLEFQMETVQATIEIATDMAELVSAQNRLRAIEEALESRGRAGLLMPLSA